MQSVLSEQPCRGVQGFEEPRGEAGWVARPCQHVPRETGGFWLRFVAVGFKSKARLLRGWGLPITGSVTETDWEPHETEAAPGIPCGAQDAPSR